MRTGLILIGGSLKGIYGHTGLLSALEDESLNLKPDVIMGASAGAIVASFYAAGLSRAHMYRKMITLKADDFVDLPSKLQLFNEFIFKKARDFTGFVQGDKLEEYIREALEGHDDFKKTIIPLYVAATNLDNYEVTLFNTGTISDKVRASTAIPMLFKPKKIGKSMYIDGAVRKEVLPQVLLDVEPDLDLLIVSNFSHEHVSVEENYLESNKLPLLEIVRRVFAMHESTDWPTQIGKTKIIHIKPGVRVPVDLFNPDAALAKEVYERTRDYAINQIKLELQGDNNGTEPTK